MNWPFLHVAVNHIPIVGIPIALVLLVWGLLRGSRDLARAALVGAIIFGAAGWGVVQTGERSEEALEDARLSWFDEDRAKEHEERAEKGMYLGLAAAGLAVLALWVTRGGRPVRGPVPWGVAALLLLTAGLLAWAALAGGEIRHDEFRGSGLAPPAGRES